MFAQLYQNGILKNPKTVFLLFAIMSLLKNDMTLHYINRHIKRRQ